MRLTVILWLMAVAIVAGSSPRANAQEWCDTHIVWAEKTKLLGQPQRGGCPTAGDCDNPSTRDTFIPVLSTPFTSIQLHFVIFREDDCSNPAATEENIALQIAQLNADYAPQHIRFVGGYHWVSSTEYRHLTLAEVDPMKQAHVRDPAHQCNVFVTDLGALGIAGRATFPWDPVALTATGGIIVDGGKFGMGQKTLTHELGHALGLWHTHHGVSELNPLCDNPNPCVCGCYERADRLNGDTTGDLASDTPPTPANFSCAAPGGMDPCSNMPWGATQPQNYMGYAPDSCYSVFTPQQAGRMHCWIAARLRGWMIGPWGGETRLTSPNTSGAGDKFGSSVALSGDTALVGVPNDADAVGPYAKSAYVYVQSGGVWTRQAKLSASDAAREQHGVISVAVSGDLAIIGTPYDTHMGGHEAGSAYVFVRCGAVWTQQAKLTASDAEPGATFGMSVALSGDTAIAGAPYEGMQPGPRGAGSAYVFVRSGGVWTQQAKLTASDAAGGDAFGVSVAYSGDTAIVGARGDNHAGLAFAGSAYVFVRSGGVWIQQAKMTASDAAANDYFGISVALSGNTALVGSYADNDYTASAYVFVRSGGVWIQQAKLTASDATARDFFGYSVAVSGDTAVVGAHSDNQGAGSAYIFLRSGNVWTEQAKLSPADAQHAGFGLSVALSGDTTVIGAPIVIGGESAYVYHILAEEDGAGACCVAGVCSNLTLTNCNAAGGTFGGNGTTCTNLPCGGASLPRGSCCVGGSTGTCSLQSAAECNASGGNYSGDFTTCASHPCPTVSAAALDPGTQLQGLTISQTNPSPSNAPAGVTFPAGFVSFQVTGVTAGGPARVQLALASGIAVNSYWQFGPEPDNVSPHWYDFAFNGTTGAVINGNLITLHFVDGQRGDHDLTANGVIDDPGAPALTSAGPVTQGAPPSGAGNCGTCGAGSAPLLLFAMLMLTGLNSGRWMRARRAQATQALKRRRPSR